MSYLDSLNAEQRAAVEHGIAPDANGGPLLVIAGAGTGKTTTLATRVAHLIVNGADPTRILLLTFSRRAANEMIGRAERIVQQALGGRHPATARTIPWSGTFHAIGSRLLRSFAGRIGLSPTYTVHDREDASDLMNLVRHDLGLSDKAVRFPLKATCLAIYSHAVNSGQSLEDVLARHFPWCGAHAADLRNLFDAYVAAKQAQGVLDYDDLLLYWAAAMGEEAIAADIRAMFDHVLVDEYQDTNPLQSRIVLGLSPDGQGLTAVGDDAQAIYGFRAATVRNIIDLPTRFDPPARVVTLEQNYRSTEPILDAANAVLSLAGEGFVKHLRSDRTSGEKPRLVSVSDDIGQVAAIVERILANREMGIALKSQAVLFRTAHHSSMLEIELARRNIPFVKFGGLKFLDAAHVKDLIAVLRWAENPHDRVVGFRVLQMLPGIGPQTAAKAFERVAKTEAPFAPLAIMRPPAAARDAWPEFIDLIARLQARDMPWPDEIASVRQWFEPHFERRYPDAAVRSGDLEQLVRIAQTVDSRARFLTDLVLDAPDATSDEAGAPLLDEDYLILSTIHSAKGQEWQVVFVLNVVDGCIPSDMSTGRTEDIEEERRLLYVAMTRAREQLHLLIPQRFYVHQQARNGDRHLFASRTRFIPNRIVDRFDACAWPPRRITPAPVATAGAASVDLKAKLGGMWKRG